MDDFLPPFQGFGPAARTWFQGLAADNSKAYFDANRKAWQDDIRFPLECLLHEARERIPGRVRMFRPNRDIRFSKDKRPYKEAAYGVIQPDGSGGGYYAAVSATGFAFGAGYYGMEKDQVARFRAAVAHDLHGPKLMALVEKAERDGVDIRGDGVATAPRGFAKDHPRIRLIRMAEVILRRTLPEDADLGAREPLERALEFWATITPVMAWLDTHVGPAEVPVEDRFGR